MARFLRFSPNALRLLLPSPQNPNPSSSSLLKTLTPSSPAPPPLLVSPRSFSGPGPGPGPGTSPSAFDDRLLCLLRSEISYLARYLPPLRPPDRFRSFSVEDHPGEQWIRLRCTHGADDVKVDATMFDGAAAVPDESLFNRVMVLEQGPRLHISLVVEVSRGGGKGEGAVLEFICSAWPDSLVVHKVFPLRKKGTAVRPYMGRNFKELEAGDRRSVVEYLEERGVDDELAEFLHWYILNKAKSELLRWLRIVESYVQK